MMRLGHQAAAQAGWLTLATLTPMPGWQEVAAGAVVASSMCADDWSPDADQGGYVARVLPGGHRGVTHMPEVVTAGIWLVHGALDGRGYDWFWRAAAVGWGTHLAADFLFGRIPFLLLGGRRAGLGLRTGGAIEAAITWLLTVACLPLAWLALGWPNPWGT